MAREYAAHLDVCITPCRRQQSFSRTSQSTLCSARPLIAPSTELTGIVRLLLPLLKKSPTQIALCVVGTRKLSDQRHPEADLMRRRIAESRGLTPFQDDGFSEIDRGRWLGLNREQITARFPGDLESFASDPSVRASKSLCSMPVMCKCPMLQHQRSKRRRRHACHDSHRVVCFFCAAQWCGHGGETYTQLFNRVTAARDRAIAKARADGCKAICVVSHMWVTKSMITDIQGFAPTQQSKWTELKVPTASISLVKYPMKGDLRLVNSCLP